MEEKAPVMDRDLDIMAIEIKCYKRINGNTCPNRARNWKIRDALGKFYKDGRLEIKQNGLAIWYGWEWIGSQADNGIITEGKKNQRKTKENVHR